MNRARKVRSDPKGSQYLQPNGLGGCKPCCRERNFWMQRREAEIGPRDRKGHAAVEGRLPRGIGVSSDFGMLPQNGASSSQPSD
jgi:hypothetical protein